MKQLIPMEFNTIRSKGFDQANESRTGKITIPVANFEEAENLARTINYLFNVEYLLENVETKQQSQTQEVSIKMNVDDYELDETQEKANQLKETLTEVKHLIDSLTH